MLDGDAVPLTKTVTNQTFPNGPFKSIFWLANEVWLRWNAIVTVARSAILDDTTDRIYYTFDDGSGPPMVTNLALAQGTPIGDITTDTFVIAAIGSAQNVPVNDYGFVVGQTVTVSDGTHSLTGTVTQIPGTAYSAGGWQTVRVTTTATSSAGSTMAVGATITVSAPASVNFPLVSFKLGSPAPLNAPSVYYDYTQLVISSFDPCSILSTSSIADSTTANFTIAALGNPQSIHVGNAVQFTIGQTITVFDGTNNIAALVTAISVPILTANTLSIASGSAGNTMAAGASVTVSAYTFYQSSADGSVTVDGSTGNPSPSFNLTRTANVNVGVVVYIYKDFSALSLPVSSMQFDFNLKDQVGILGGCSLSAVAGASSSGYGNGVLIQGVIRPNTLNELTSGSFTIAAIGSTQNLSLIGVTHYFVVGDTVAISDGTHKILGSVTFVSGSALTVKTISIPFGAAGNTMSASAYIGAFSYQIASSISQSWSDYPTLPVLQVNYVTQTLPIQPGTFYTCKIFYFGEFSDGFHYMANVYSGGSGGVLGTIIASITFSSNIGPQGSYCGWSAYSESNITQYESGGTVWIDNLGAQNFISDGSSKETDYVQTYVNQLGMESAPSPISNLFITADGLNKIITLPPIPGAGETSLYGSTFLSDYAIIGRRLYRAATSSAGTSELLVADETVLNLGINTFTDTLTDADLGVALPSSGWELPPVNSKSIISLPNGLTALISNNQICIGPVGIAHAFPENSEGAATYRYPTDTQGVKLGNIDSTLVALTQGFPYIASGVDPTSFSMGKLEKSYGCVSGRGVVYLRQYGVIYPSTVGFMAIAGAGIRNMTQAYFDIDTWQFLNPPSIVASVRDDRIIGFCMPIDGTVRGFIFDPKEEGQAWAWFDLSTNLDFTQVPADGYYTDDISGNTYMIRGSNLDVFDATAGSLTPDFLVQIWQSKVFRAPYTTALNYACIKPRKGYNYAVSPLNHTLTIDGVTVTQGTVYNREAFTVGCYAGEDIVVQVKGAWPFEQIDYASDVEELT